MEIDCDSNNSSQDEIDSKKWLTGMLESFKSPSYSLNNKDDFEYNMNHKKRGLAVIFNHFEFQDGLGLSAREGTSNDVFFNLKHCLSLHSFDVKVHSELKAAQVYDEIYTLSKVEDHTKHDCLMVIVLSHGDVDKIYAQDRAYKPDILWDSFTADNCPSLAGKPKIFLIQACKGDQLDGGSILHQKQSNFNTIVSDGIESKSTYYRIPNRADFLITYSTVPGYYSWRNIASGSWFIQAFVEMLVLFSEKKDLLTIMTLVARRIAIGFESNTSQIEMHMKKQVPYITSTLIRNVYLRKK